MKLGLLRRALTHGFRRRRMQDFARAFEVSGRTNILDIGGTPLNWNWLPEMPTVVMVNVTIPAWARAKRDGRLKWVIADARRLPFRDRAFDIAFSNAVIEHVGTFDKQRLFAEECKRVGRRYFVETPNRRFFFEPHLLTPFIHWLPRRTMGRLIRNFSIWGIMTRPSAERCSQFMRDVWLLDAGQMEELFRDGRVRQERFLGMPKSIIAARMDQRLDGASERAVAGDARRGG